MLVNKQYGLINLPIPIGMGNVLTTVSDRKIPHTSDNITIDYYTSDITSAQDYYAGGMLLPGRNFNASAHNFGYQGSLKDREITGTEDIYSTFFRELDTRTLRWWAIDPKTVLTPWESPYVSMGNNPIWHNDILGDADGDPNKKAQRQQKRFEKKLSRFEKKLDKKGLSEEEKFAKISEKFGNKGISASSIFGEKAKNISATTGNKFDAGHKQTISDNSNNPPLLEPGSSTDVPILFEDQSAVFKEGTLSQSESIVAGLANQLNQPALQEKNITITGKTSGTYDTPALTLQRAQNVAELFIRNGLSASRINVKAGTPATEEEQNQELEVRRQIQTVNIQVDQ